MKFVFNDSLTASIASNDDESSEVKYVASGLIFEKKIVTSATINNVDQLITALQGLSSEADKQKLMSSPDVTNLLKDPNNLSDFHKKVGIFGKPSSGGSSGSTDLVSKLNKEMIEGAESVGQPASKFAPYLESKDQIIQRLKPFMSERQIGEVFYKLEEDIKLPFTEVIGILEFCIQKSRSCNAKASDLINFFVEHYGQKRQYSLSKRLIDLGCEYQKLNPSIDIFSVLRDAAAGNQPKVGLGYLSKDPEAQLSFNNLVMLSQSSLPEQSEEIRRRFQQSRDALRSQEEKVNMQRAIYDMMKTEEMNNQLIKMIKFLGSSFEYLITNPMFRALKDMFYDLNAAKVLLNQASSIFTADTSPETASHTPFEEQQQRDETFTSIPQGKHSFSNEEYAHLKLASPEVSRHIYAQTAPKPASPEQKKEASNALAQIYNSLISSSEQVFKSIKEALASYSKEIQDAWNNSFIPKLMAIYDALKKAVSNLMKNIGNNTLSFETISKEFSDVGKAITGADNKTFLDFGTGSTTNKAVSNPAFNPNSNAALFPGSVGGYGAGLGAATYQRIGPNAFFPAAAGADIGANIGMRPRSNSKFNRIAQRAPQQGTTLPGSTKTSGYITNAIGLISTLAALIVGGITVKNALASMLRDPSDWSKILNAFFPVILGLKNVLIELFMATNLVGANAPQSSLFLDNKGNPTQQGLQIMANNQETMIALGIADEDAMALGKFAVQKEYYMQQLRTKESNLQSAESQAVQTGNPRNPETTVGDLPADFQNKLKDFLDFCTKLEPQFKAAITIMRNAINNNQQNYNDVQKTQATGRLADFEKDLIEIQSKKSEWSSMKNIAAHMMRKRILLQKLKPLQTQLDTMKKLGIPMANVIASPNGILAQVGRIRSEEQQALEKLRKEYYEKMDLLKNPDKIAPLTKYPLDTGVTKLPESPDQSEPTESPFDVPDDSQFKETGGK